MSEIMTREEYVKNFSLLHRRVSSILNREQNEGKSFLGACNEIWKLLDVVAKEFPKPLGDMIDPLDECKKKPLYDTEKIIEWKKKWLGEQV